MEEIGEKGESKLKRLNSKWRGKKNKYIKTITNYYLPGTLKFHAY